MSERRAVESLPLNVFQSVHVRSPVAVEDAFQIPIVTFGPTVEFAQLVIVIDGFVVEIEPNVRADCLLLKVFQSVDESAPVVEAEASPREIPVPEIESPFGVPEMNPSLLLKVFQSVELRKPLVEVFAWAIPKTPVRLL